MLGPEHRQILASKPIERIRRFAALLGWKGLQPYRIRFTTDEIAKWDVPGCGLLVSYVTTDKRFFLQINETKPWGAGGHQASIAADRYDIGSIGWHPFELFDDDARLKLEADRVRPWLDRRNYRNPVLRREFKRHHPELLLASRKKTRGRQSAYVGRLRCGTNGRHHSRLVSCSNHFRVAGVGHAKPRSGEKVAFRVK
jgi:hypothetical protein